MGRQIKLYLNDTIAALKNSFGFFKLLLYDCAVYSHECKTLSNSELVSFILQKGFPDSYLERIDLDS